MGSLRQILLIFIAFENGVESYVFSGGFSFMVSYLIMCGIFDADFYFMTIFGFEADTNLRQFLIFSHL